MVRFIHPKRGKPGRPKASPLLGKTVTGTITDLGAQGAGVMRIDGGMTVFVTGAWLDETVDAKITQVKQNTAFARVLRVQHAHPERQQPPCPYQGFDQDDCGGCPWMVVSYRAQLQAKHQRVLNAAHTLGVDRERCPPIIGAAQPLHYRQRAQLKTDGTRLGFVAAGTHQIKDIDRCLIVTDALQAKLRKLREQLPNPAWRKRGREFTAIDINETDISVQQRLPFQQASAAQNQTMRTWLATEFDRFDRGHKVLELFAGSGNFTEILARSGRHNILACESVAEATKALEQLGLPGVDVLTCNLFSDQALVKLGHFNADILVLDPPREGFKQLPALLAQLPELREVFYISCDLATFTRDAKALIERGFCCELIQSLDAFAQTPHLELLTRFRKSDRRL